MARRPAKAKAAETPVDEDSLSYNPVCIAAPFTTPATEESGGGGGGGNGPSAPQTQHGVLIRIKRKRQEEPMDALGERGVEFPAPFATTVHRVRLAQSWSRRDGRKGAQCSRRLSSST
jgi:hypothetical protein